MANIQFLPQETLVIDDIEYLVTAMPATEGLLFMGKYQEAIDSGKADLIQMRDIICKYVSKGNMQITTQSFDTIFARKYAHLQKLYQDVLQFNFAEVFQEAGSDEA